MGLQDINFDSKGTSVNDSNPIIISANGDTSRVLNEISDGDTITTVIGLGKDLSKFNENYIKESKYTTIINNEVLKTHDSVTTDSVITYAPSTDDYIKEVISKSDTILSQINQESKIKNIINAKEELSSKDSITSTNVVTYPNIKSGIVYADRGVNKRNILSNLIPDSTEPRSVIDANDTIPINQSIESESMKAYEANLVKVLGLTNSKDEDELRKSLEGLSRAADKILNVNGSNDELNYLRATLQSVSVLTTPALLRATGVSEVITKLKTVFGSTVSLTNEFQTGNINTLINSAISRAIVKSVNRNIFGSQDNNKGFGMPTNSRNLGIFNGITNTAQSIFGDGISIDFEHYLKVQQSYLNNHLSAVTKTSGQLGTYKIWKDTGKMAYTQMSPESHNKEDSPDLFTVYDKGDLTTDLHGYFVAYDAGLWDFTIEPYSASGSSSNLRRPPDHPFLTFFPATDVSIDEIDAANTTSIPLPWNRNLNLPGDKSIPKNITVNIFENQYLAVDQWLHNIMDYIYSPDGKGGYTLAKFTESAYVLTYHFLDPQLRTIRKWRYLGIPEFNFRYNGSSSSELISHSIVFTIVGADHY